MNKRLETLKSLVSFSKPLDELSSNLSEFSWDCDREPLVVTSSQIAEVLMRYISGEIDAGELEQWANMLECREDIEFEENNEEQLENVIYSLANPELEGEINIDLCNQFLKDLPRL
ncbi:hypothetical protein [Shewanella sp.]|uniref:hypothetical protein n=1 Tax=Shewanella sp. TaxID=50422 RepID=UPI003D0C61E1